MTREQLIEACLSALHTNGFAATTFLDTNTCFDIIARKTDSTLLIKVYDNIDSIRKEQGEELVKMACTLGARAAIIGAKTKVFRMEDSTVYYRYGVPAMTIGTFRALLENRNPEVSYFKGRSTVEMDFEALRRKRMELALSLHELAERIGVASETLYRFEKGASTSMETAKKLEKELDGEFIRGLDIMGPRLKPERFDDVPEEKLLEKLHGLGMKMALFEHAPFDAYGEVDRGMLISTGKGKFDIPKKALELRKATTAVKSDSIIVTKEYKLKSVEGIPVIEEADLDTIGRIKELKKLIREKEGK
ncbi:MAG: helix-turn-helix domain-containing protein [Candidatus Diapherotrites archaeon]|uniref:Putative HTH-type transcriptional regulatory protein HY544_00230 n=1 Tax=Candidatus Iainarchaeum sp. TaxID=3101447 RepID=A0A8T3YHC8_9ARCH|nr:helix-turn-helix domain-containing protein [Candidatus Diapherotrites archaeon]